jgi:hypothetical protein
MTAGQELVSRIVDDMAARGLEPDAKEHELLAIAAGLADQIEALTEDVRREGYSSRLKSGRIVIHPAVAEIRAASTALSKVIEGVEMGEGIPLNRTKQRAAQARWRQRQRETN